MGNILESSDDEKKATATHHEMNVLLHERKRLVIRHRTCTGTETTEQLSRMPTGTSVECVICPYCNHHNKWQNLTVHVNENYATCENCGPFGFPESSTPETEEKKPTEVVEPEPEETPTAPSQMDVILTFRLEQGQHSELAMRESESPEREQKQHQQDTAMMVETYYDQSNNKTVEWVVDSGENTHATNQPRRKFTNYRSRIQSAKKGIDITCIGIGDIQGFTNVNHSPQMIANLLSVSQLTQQGYLVAFDEDAVFVLTEEAKVLYHGKKSEDGLYKYVYM